MMDAHLVRAASQRFPWNSLIGQLDALSGRWDQAWHRQSVAVRIPCFHQKLQHVPALLFQAGGDCQQTTLAEATLLGLDAIAEFAMNHGLPDTPDGQLEKLVETAKGHIHAKVEHPFRVIKQQFAFQRTKLWAMNKTRPKVDVLHALTSLFLARHQLMAIT